MFKKVFVNTGAQIVGKAITATTTLLVTFLISRSLGPAGYGDFTKIFVFIGYFYTLADFGLNSIFIKIAKEDTGPLLKSLIALRLLVGFFLGMSSIFIAFLLPYNPEASTGFSPLVKTGIVIASITIITQALFTSANAYFQKTLRYHLSTIAASVGALFVLFVTIFVTISSKSILGYTAAYVLGGLSMVAIAYWLIYKKTNEILLPRLDLHQSSKLLTKAWPIGVALIFNLIYFRLDVFILSNFRSSAEVGLYGLAYQFFEASLSTPIFFTNAIYPLLTKIYSKDLSEFNKQFKNWILILLVVSLALTFVLILISFLIPYIFGQGFSGSVLSLQILAIGIPFFFISALLWQVLIILDKQKYLTVIYAAGALFNLIANLMFIPQYGYIAASIITVVSEGLITLLLILAIRIRNFQFKIRNL